MADCKHGVPTYEYCTECCGMPAEAMPGRDVPFNSMPDEQTRKELARLMAGLRGYGAPKEGE